MLAQGAVIGVDDLPGAVRGILATASQFRQDPKPPVARLPRRDRRLREAMRDREREEIESALEEGRSVSGASRILGIPRQTLQYRIKVLGIRGTSLA
jgi:transcriptional regulator with PAS, ATPase and Fis domain